MTPKQKKSYMIEYNKRNKDRLSKMNRAYYGKDRARYLKMSRINRWKHKGIKITFEEYEGLRFQQGGRCAICKRLESELTKALAVDHDHFTGKIRGLLCLECNLYIVRTIEKYGNLIDKAKDYLGVKLEHANSL